MIDGTDFTEEQKQYLDGFLRGVAARRGVPSADADAPAARDIHRAAQDRFIAAGKRLTPEEEAKRKSHPLDMWDELRVEAAEGRFPKGIDVFRHKFFGLFYVAPAQDAFMCRLRIPNGILTADQMTGLAALAERWAGGSADVTTRANLQLREIKPQGIIEVLTGIQDLGLTTRGAGADNIRNLTGSPTAGIDAQELIDTRPLVHALHHTILNHRELYGLPRKFNIAFDGGGKVSVLEDTNDIGFAAVEVRSGACVPEGVYFRLLLGGITGHGDFARDTGIVLTPSECLGAAIAAVRVFIAAGDRTDRKRARLKYLLDAWGLEKFIDAVEKERGAAFTRLPLEACAPRGPIEQHGHIGIHPQRQPGLNFLGAVLPVGRLTDAQLRGIGAIAAAFGSGTVRLTVWQNLIISDVPTGKLGPAQDALGALGLGVTASALRGALVACTGNTGCKFAATDTKWHAMRLVEYLENRVSLDQPINIHLTGCPNSCAQHAIGDIGLLGVKVGKEMSEGYTIFVGGGAGEGRRLGREIFAQVPMEKLPRQLEAMLKTYLARRRDGESFKDFAARHSIEALRSIFASGDSEETAA
ncbi:MAG TPA: NirA family protein [Stellaceae bacterium]|nr:NirA family protein [Stellaceae bacterium]